MLIWKKPSCEITSQVFGTYFYRISEWTNFSDENTELKEELALEKSISDDFDRQVKKQRGQIEKLLDVIDQKEQMIQALKAENCELKDGVNSIYSYLSTEQQKLMTTVREKIQNYQNES